MQQTTDLNLPATTETGSLGIFHLKRLWQKCLYKRNGHFPKNALPDEWLYDHGVLNALGVSLEDSLQFLFQDSKTFDDFENWVRMKAGGNISKEKIELFNALCTENKEQEKKLSVANENVLSDEDHRFFNEHGYIILRDVISKEQCAASEKVVWEFLGYNPDDPNTWYEPHASRKGIMVQFFHHALLEANRNSEKIHRAYIELYGHDRLFVTTDRVSFNPPETALWKFPGPRLHWDAKLKVPFPFGLQGILYLTDTRADQGAFTLVPGFQHKLEQWLTDLPTENDPQSENLEALGTKAIAANAGDFIIWHHALPHGSSPNTADRPRIVQYINWQPLKEK